MTNDHCAIIKTVSELPEYKSLISKKRIVAIPLALTMLVAYYTFILLVAYNPTLLSTRMGDGITSLGIVLGLGLIGLTFAITAFFVWYANAHLEPLVEEIQKKVDRHV